MDQASQLVIEVCFVSLPATEMEERRQRIRVLLLRGACRFIQQQLPEKLPAVEPVTVGPAQE
jgi:hypothetical protein